MKQLVAAGVVGVIGYLAITGWQGEYGFSQTFIAIACVAVLAGLVAGMALRGKDPTNALWILLISGAGLGAAQLGLLEDLPFLSLEWQAEYWQPSIIGIGIGSVIGMLLVRPRSARR